jgi:arabinogalactan endo-1,4-beta-galactosidase
MAKRAQAAGMKISIDFHYSDYWADPGKQYKPQEWRSLSPDDLGKAVYDFTKEVVQALVKQGTTPVMVQVGNEITAGMLWPDGKVDSDKPEQWARLGKLLKEGLRAVHDAEGGKRILTMIHLDKGGDNGGAVWWFDHAKAQGVEFDLIGLSYYPFWHGHLAAMKANLSDLATRYGKDIYIAETAYPWTDKRGGFPEIQRKLEPGYPATPEGQAAFLREVLKALQQVPGGHGKGILYWAPTWISPPGKNVPWDTLATFGDHGEALPAVDALGGRG